MARPILFFDLAGTLEVRNPTTGRYGPWPGVDGLLAELAVDHDLHVATGDKAEIAESTLGEYGLRRWFRGVHADLPAGGKPFGALAESLGREPEECLAIGDHPLNDTAGDSERVVSLLVQHGRTLVEPARVGAVVRALGAGPTFLAGFLAAIAAGGAGPASGTGGAAVRLQDLPPTDLGGGGRLGWWWKGPQARRAVVVLAG